MIRAPAKWLVVCLGWLGLLVNAQAVDRIDATKLDADIQTMKMEVLSLADDLALLDSGILSISGNPLIVYLSLDVDEGFQLQAVDLELNGRFAARREFNEKTLNALTAGGIRRIYVKNLPSGDYTLKAALIGQVGKGKEHRSNISFVVHKTDTPKTIELKVVNYRQKYVPEFKIEEWQ